MLVLPLAIVVAALQEVPSPHPIPRLPDDPEFRAQIQSFGQPVPPRTIGPKELLTTAEAAAAAAPLADEEIVVGLVLGEEARAWPIEVLSHAEVLNDTLAGVPIAITWCVMCQTAVVHRRTVDDRSLTFGNARATRHHNMLLFDLETGSFWQQVTGEALHGPLAGRLLESIPTHLCTWADWRRDHPATRVLIDQVAPNRNRKAFRVFQEAGLQYMGLVVRIGADARYFPLDLLEQKGCLEDSLADVPLLIVFARERRLLQAWRRPAGAAGIVFDLAQSDAGAPRIVERAAADRGAGERAAPDRAAAERSAARIWDAASGRPVDADAGALALEPLLGSPMTSGRFTRLFPNGTRFGPPRRGRAGRDPDDGDER